MPLAEGVSARIAYKFYSSGVITPNQLADSATDPGATGAQILRRVSSTLALQKNTYQSAEIRSDRQIADFRHGTQSVQGNIAGEFSPETYFDLIEAVHRDTRAAGVSLSQVELTSIAASASSGTFTFAGGDPVALGLKIGSIMRSTGNTASELDNTNFVITGFSGANNRTVNVTPKPSVDSAASTTFTVTQPGKSTIIPASGHVSRKAAFEVYHADLDIARLYTECRLGSYQFTLPATGMSTCQFTVYGRHQEDFADAAAPYFTSPNAESTTGIFAAVNGALLLGGSAVGVVTSADLTMNLSPTTAEVVGQNFPAEIFLGRANGTGNLTAFLDSNALIDDFINESELELLLYLTTSNAANAPASTLYLPRIKFGSAAVNLTGEGGQSVTFAYQALKYEGSTAGKVNSTIQICDTEVA